MFKFTLAYYDKEYASGSSKISRGDNGSGSGGCMITFYTSTRSANESNINWINKNTNIRILYSNNKFSIMSKAQYEFIIRKSTRSYYGLMARGNGDMIYIMILLI